MAEEKKPKKDKKLFELGPMEQILVVLGIMAFGRPLPAWRTSHCTYLTAGAHPSMPWSMAGGTLTSIPLFSPASLMLVFIAYFGFHLLKRQEGERDRQKALAKAKAKSSSSSSSSSDPRSRSAMTSEQMRARGGMPSSSMTPRTGDPSPKQVSKSSRSNPASNTFKGNYFMTMQGPGRPALVPFQSGLRPKEGEEAGTMWWDNVPEDAKELMAPAVNEDTARKVNKMTNPWALDALTKDIALFRLEKERREEEAYVSPMLTSTHV
jgi:hypothetical protein